MSQTQHTPTMSETTLETSSKPKRGRPAKSSTESTERVVSISDVVGQAESAEAHAERMKIAEKIVQLDAAVAYAVATKAEWIEVDEAVLKHFYKGEIHPVGYYIYKNIKLCLAGKAESLAARDGLSCHEIVFPKDQFTCGVRRAAK